MRMGAPGGGGDADTMAAEDAWKTGIGACSSVFYRPVRVLVDGFVLNIIPLPPKTPWHHPATTCLPTRTQPGSRGLLNAGGAGQGSSRVPGRFSLRCGLRVRP
jgi:hypothetical protein